MPTQRGADFHCQEMGYLHDHGDRRLQKFARTEPEKFIQIENTFAGSAAATECRMSFASAPAIPPFCIPPSVATVRSSRSSNLKKRPSSRVTH